VNLCDIDTPAVLADQEIVERNARCGASAPGTRRKVRGHVVSGLIFTISCYNSQRNVAVGLRLSRDRKRAGPVVPALRKEN
jgi:hypothetical protein